METLRNGVTPNFGDSRIMTSNPNGIQADDPGEKHIMLADVIEVGIENEKDRSKRTGMNKSSSAVPFINAEETSNSGVELYPDLSKDMNNGTRVI